MLTHHRVKIWLHPVFKILTSTLKCPTRRSHTKSSCTPQCKFFYDTKNYNYIKSPSHEIDTSSRGAQTKSPETKRPETKRLWTKRP